MKFLRVGTTKLKIALSAEESAEYNISADESEFNKKEMRGIITRILKDARSQCGFDIGEEKVLIQIYPSVFGGVDIFVTKLTSLAEGERRVVLASDNVSSVERVSSVFRFDTLEHLILAARSVRNKDIVSDAYLGDDGAYYITAREESINGMTALLSFIEFGEKLPELPYDVARERGRRLREGDAIAEFSKM